MKSQLKQVVFRASGKVLVAGGYGVLEEGNQGISLAVDKHFYSISTIEKGDGSINSYNVEVKSPQIDSSWHYIYNLNQKEIQFCGGQKNVFVENAVKYALDFCLSRTKQSIKTIKITILFDRGFLSETPEQKNIKDKFINYSNNTSKTGLGSSACVVVAVVGGILKLLLEKMVLEEVNVLSHMANIAAQNKIGSNFDISTALYGSQLYTNVLPKKAYEAIKTGNVLGLLEVSPEIKQLKINENFLQHSESWLIDLRKGSNTRTMVSGFIKILHQQSEDIQTEFFSGNKTFVKELYDLLCSQLEQKDFMNQMKEYNFRYRKFIQRYTEITKVPVEPPQFNSFIDKMLGIKQVIYCLCPGSGGYDAIFVLAMIEKKGEIQSIENQLKEVCFKENLQCEISRVKIEWEFQKIQEKEMQEIDLYLGK